MLIWDDTTHMLYAPFLRKRVSVSECLLLPVGLFFLFSSPVRILILSERETYWDIAIGCCFVETLNRPFNDEKILCVLVMTTIRANKQFNTMYVIIVLCFPTCVKLLSNKKPLYVKHLGEAIIKKQLVIRKAEKDSLSSRGNSFSQSVRRGFTILYSPCVGSANSESGSDVIVLVCTEKC